MNYIAALAKADVVKTLAVAGGGVCVASLLIAYFFMERYLLLEPCPLCILDRIVVGGMAVVCFVIAAMPVHKTRRLVLCGANAVLLTFGFVFALRHIWLQNRPIGELNECLSSNEAAASLIDIIARAFDANADCGSISWEFLGLTIPEQVLLLFIALLFLQAVMVFFIIKQAT